MQNAQIADTSARMHSTFCKQEPYIVFYFIIIFLHYSVVCYDNGFKQLSLQ